MLSHTMDSMSAAEHGSSTDARSVLCLLTISASEEPTRFRIAVLCISDEVKLSRRFESGRKSGHVRTVQGPIVVVVGGTIHSQ